jgi:hypothetical protein
VLRSVEEKQKVAPEVVEKMQNIIASKPVTQRDSKFDKGSRAFNFLKGMNKPVINISETSLWKKFLKACKKGNPKIVKEILQTHPNIANEGNRVHQHLTYTHSYHMEQTEKWASQSG